MIHNSETMSHREYRAWWQMEKDASKQMDSGEVRITHTGLHWDRAMGLISRQQEQPAIWPSEQSPAITKIIQLGRQACSQCCVSWSEHQHCGLHRNSPGQHFTCRIVCQSVKLRKVFRYDCLWCLHVFWVD